MISRTAEHALRAAICLAARPAASLTTCDIAAVTHVPIGYLAKTMHMLVRSGIVTSRRGTGGGFLLAKAVDQLTLLEVIHAVDGPMGARAASDASASTSSSTPTMPSDADRALLRELAGAAARAADALRVTTVADILRDPAVPGRPG
jgi:Rrf2 family protein